MTSDRDKQSKTYSKSRVEYIVKITILCHDRRRPVSIRKRTQAFYDRSKPFLSILTDRNGLKRS
jgi:hypothetical protein